MFLKTIETRYKGYLFRSRLEARHAVFFDALEIPWRYEVEGFDLGGIRYLPDFWLPHQDCWIEVKGTSTDTRESWSKCQSLANASGKRVWMLFDEFCPVDFRSDSGLVRGSNRGWEPPSEKRPDGEFHDGCCEWSECPLCHFMDIGFLGNHSTCGCICDGEFSVHSRLAEDDRCKKCGERAGRGPRGRHVPYKKTHDSARLMAAYGDARSARFEFGQSGAERQVPVPHHASIVHVEKIVAHPVHGQGRVVSITGCGENTKMEVQFVASGRRAFVVELCKWLK
jgi:hypothetical protein